MWTTKRSLVSGSLDADDLYGPGACRFSRLTGSVYTDYALFKISLFAQSQDLEERKKFAEGLTQITKELGRFAGDYLPPLLLSLVVVTQVHNEPEVRLICIAQLPKLRTLTGRLAASIVGMYSALLTHQDGDVADAACQSFQSCAPSLCSVGCESEVMVALLQVVHMGNSPQGKLLCIQLLCALSSAFGPELTRRFVVNELLSIVDDLGTADKKVIAENFLHLWANVDPSSFRRKLMPMFARLASYSDGLVRIGTLSAFAPGLDAAHAFGILPEVSDEFVKWYHALLSDGSKLVQQQAHMTLPLVLCALRAPSAVLMSSFMESFSRTSAKEYILTCAQCLPAIIGLYGAEGWGHIRLIYTKTLGKADAAAAQVFCSRIHDVAKAVGPEHTERDLVPIYNDFHKNKMLRLTLISNLGAWIAALPTDERDTLFSYLQALGASKDWRERAVLGQELGRILPVLSKSLDDSLLRLSINIAMDRYDRVSACGCVGVASILTQLATYNREAADSGLDLVKVWSTSRSWTARKRFLRVAAHLDCRKCTAFPSIRDAVLALTKDPVANARVLVAEIAVKYGDRDFEFAAVRDSYRTEKDVDVSRTVALQYDERVKGTSVLPPTLFSLQPPKEGESRLQLDGRTDIAEVLGSEVYLDEFSFPVSD